MTKNKPNHGAMVFLMKSSKPSTNNKEDSNSSAPAPSSKKDTAQWTSAQPAYGTPTMMDQSPLNMKMTNYTASSAYSVALHKYLKYPLGKFKFNYLIKR